MARKKLVFDDAQIMFKNFSGNRWREGGAKDFAVKINPSDVDTLLADNWPIKVFTPTDDQENPIDDPIPFFKAKIKYENYPPAIYLVTSGGATLLDDDSVGELDSAEIIYIDLIVSLAGKDWSLNGKTGRSAYVDEMYVTIAESSFAQKYGIHNPRD